jgi:hypothetical protein
MVPRGQALGEGWLTILPSLWQLQEDWLQAMECKPIGRSVIEIFFVGNPHVSFIFGLLY